MFPCLDILINCLLADCEAVLTLLCSEVLQTEIRVLYELLYVLNNGFRQHKPFRALKQVGTQCFNVLYKLLHNYSRPIIKSPFLIYMKYAPSAG